MYHVFPVKGNPRLEELVRERLAELGYDRPPACCAGVSYALSIGDNGRPTNRSVIVTGYGSVAGISAIYDHQLGDLTELLFGEKYRVVKPISVDLGVGGYVAEVTPGGVKVGCTTFTLEKARELAAAVEQVSKS